LDAPYNLHRFVEAQQRCYEQALGELGNGRKTSHWMWFIFPQIAGLGFSTTAQFYAISSLDEARAYLEDPLLGARLRTCVEAVNRVEGSSAHDIFGSPDDLKFRSSMTLFAAADPTEPLFREALRKYYAGERDPLTLEKLAL
jgi:uncharacterized protein (DUF1810 family)